MALASSFCIIGLVLYFGTADALSWLPLPNDSNGTTENALISSEWHMLVNFIDSSPVASEHIHKKTNKDPTISKVFKFCELGWPISSTSDLNLTPYV